jgi:transcription elongation GreA/GreB family factor
MTVKAQADALRIKLRERHDLIRQELEAVEKELATEQINLKERRNEGDVTENEDYVITGAKVSMLEERRRRTLRTIRVLEEFDFEGYVTDGIFVVVGSTVVFEDTAVGSTQTFMIVPHDLAAAEEGFISLNSPVGAKTVGKRVGAPIGVRTSRGELSYRIKEVY